MLCVGLVVAAAVVFFVLARRAEAALVDRFPPISDAEFVARSSPGTSPEVALKVRRIVADHLAVEYDRIHPSARFIEDLGAD
ncbi:MAG: hypothetical protein K2X87_12295 [Gemmataceae bacterium]|nr:hypothetical protein [Gemmataceae bacterium]